MAYIGNNNLPFDSTRTAAQPRDAERFSGNGSTTNFTLSRTPPNGAIDVTVYVENVAQEPIVAYDVVGNSLNFTEAPPTGTYNIYVVYRNTTGSQVIMPDGSVSYNKLANNLRLFTTDNLTPNGNNSVFTLSEPPADANTVFVTVDGMVQRAPVHYTTSGSTITFTSAPPAGSNVHVRHLGFRTSVAVTAIPVATYIPQPNIASPTITGTILLTAPISGDLTVSGNINVASGLVFANSVTSRVGIGTANTTDNYKLTIDGTSTLGTRIKSVASGSAAYLYFDNGLKQSSIALGTQGAAAANVFYFTHNGNETLRYSDVTDGGGSGFWQLGTRRPMGHQRYDYTPGGATSSYTAQFTLPSWYGLWEVSVYAYRNVGGSYGTYYGCWHFAGLDGYPYSVWASGLAQISSFGTNQTTTGPTLTSMTAAASGVCSLTLGNYPGGITIVARMMTDGRSY